MASSLRLCRWCFCEVDAELPQRFWEGKGGMDEMTTEANQIYVRLSRTENGWKFVKGD